MDELAGLFSPAGCATLRGATGLAGYTSFQSSIRQLVTSPALT
jgi:hypothetical protein